MKLLTCLLMLLMSGTSLADPIASSPEVNVGDVWMYQLSDGLSNEVLFSPIRRVVAVDEHEITVEMSYKDKPPTQRNLLFFTRDWNLKENNNQKNDPYIPEFKFPLSVGNSWDMAFSSTYRNGRATKSFLKAKVSAYEKVTTPAGEFDAYRIDCKIDTVGLGVNGIIFHVTHTVWYAPQVNGFIMREVTTMSDGRIRSKEITQLLQYSPKRHSEN